ncbi:hypothetical protein [Providencia burhodogranariea]|uniref:Uncharacterized protein n=1 Tax=Providencia burhodogranariea DSM 19968 TaxID=1141662 RepID=K8WTL5_9GAMM|nr:hypothetical protein OOA_05456 [Providencia burhodogranariea DSM 19968]
MSRKNQKIKYTLLSIKDFLPQESIATACESTMLSHSARLTGSPCNKLGQAMMKMMAERLFPHPIFPHSIGAKTDVQIEPLPPLNTLVAFIGTINPSIIMTMLI